MRHAQLLGRVAERRGVLAGNEDRLLSIASRRSRRCWSKSIASTIHGMP